VTDKLPGHGEKQDCCDNDGEEFCHRRMDVWWRVSRRVRKAQARRAAS
jgi:hypothetical protein